jgi:hypothetical protein
MGGPRRVRWPIAPNRRAGRSIRNFQVVVVDARRRLFNALHMLDAAAVCGPLLHVSFRKDSGSFQPPDGTAPYQN